MLGGSGGKYWAAARTPLPPTPPPLPPRMCIGVFGCAQQSGFFRGVTSYFTDACSGSRLRMTQCFDMWRHNVC